MNLAVRPSIVSGQAGSEVLIRWQDLPAYEDSREPFEVIQAQFPHFNLEDKVNAWVAGNDKPKIQKLLMQGRRKENNQPQVTVKNYTAW